MILTLGLHAPAELDGHPCRRVERLPPVRGGRRLAGLVPPGELATIVAVGAHARSAATLVALEGDRRCVDAVILVQPLSGGERDDRGLVDWLPLALEAARPGGPLLAIWAAYQAPRRPGQRHPYDLAYGLAGEAAAAYPHPAHAAPIDIPGLLAWAPGEILCGPAGQSWTAAPEVQTHAHGGLVVVVDRGAAEGDPGQLAELYGPGALVRGFLLPRWRAGLRRRPLQAPAAAAARPRSAPRPPPPAQIAIPGTSDEAEGGAIDELDGLITSAEDVGRAIGHGARAAQGLAHRARGLWGRARRLFEG